MQIRPQAESDPGFPTNLRTHSWQPYRLAGQNQELTAIAASLPGPGVGSVTVPRQHIEEIRDSDDGAMVEVKLGAWISNTRTRRAKLTGEQLDQLAALGLDWR